MLGLNFGVFLMQGLGLAFISWYGRTYMIRVYHLKNTTMAKVRVYTHD